MKVELQGRVASVGIGRDDKPMSTIDFPDPRLPNLPTAQAITISGLARLGASAKVTVEVEE